MSQLLCAPPFNDLLRRIDNGTQMVSASSLKKYGCHLSFPCDLCGLSLFNFVLTVSDVISYSTGRLLHDKMGKVEYLYSTGRLLHDKMGKVEYLYSTGRLLHDKMGKVEYLYSAGLVLHDKMGKVEYFADFR